MVDTPNRPDRHDFLCPGTLEDGKQCEGKLEDFNNFVPEDKDTERY